MFQEGLGEQAEFYTYHPWVNVCCFMFVIGVAMFSSHPLFLALGLAGSCTYSALLKGNRAWKTNGFIVVIMAASMSIINGLFTHNGTTVLCYINGNRITAEAFIYGGCMALLLAEVIIWFGCFQVIMCSDKFIFLFGKLAPVLGLTLSMIFRFIPLLQQRFQEIHNGQKCMGRNYDSGFWFQKVRRFFKEVSILISWSLEASIESSDSMEARGYGLRGRTSFHLYRFTGRDGRAAALVSILGILSAAGCVMGKTSIYYYPSVWFKAPDLYFYIALSAYVGLMLVPIMIDLRGEQKWKRLNLEM